MLTAADIENAARARLAELDEQAKPHEAALAEINVERVALRRMLAPAGASIVRTSAPVWPFNVGATLAGTSDATAIGEVRLDDGPAVVMDHASGRPAVAVLAHGDIAEVAPIALDIGAQKDITPAWGPEHGSLGVALLAAQSRDAA